MSRGMTPKGSTFVDHLPCQAFDTLPMCPVAAIAMFDPVRQDAQSIVAMIQQHPTRGAIVALFPLSALTQKIKHRCLASGLPAPRISVQAPSWRQTNPNISDSDHF